MSSLPPRRARSNLASLRVPKMKRARLHLEHLEDRTMLDATGIPLDNQMLAAARELTTNFFTPQVVETKNGITSTPIDPGFYTGSWVVGVPAGMTETGVASRLGGTSVGATGIIQNTYILDFGTQFADQVLRNLQTEEAAGNVEWFYPLLAQRITADFTPNDPFYPQQWHLNQATNEDINAPEAWDLARGVGVVIGIVDDGVQMNHPDLAANLWVNPGDSTIDGVDNDVNGRIDDTNGWDFLNNDRDPSPVGTGTTADPHGTAVAGMAAAVGNNATGVAGVAFMAKFAPIRLFTNTITPAPTDQQIADTMLYKNQNIHIYNNSWGPASSTTYQFAGPLTLAAYNTAATSGRGGLGSVIVRSAGNNGIAGNVNRSMLRNNRNAITVASVLQTGLTNTISNVGPAILVSAPTNPSVSSATLTNGTTISTDRTTTADGYNFNPAGGNDDYTNRFGDTSAASAVVSGVVALMLEENPNLRLSDVQEILARTARKNAPADVGWTVNGAGLNVHHNFGFGVVNAQAAVQMAATWVPRVQNSITSGTIPTNLFLPDSPNPGVIVSTTMPAMPGGATIQAVEVEVNLTHTWRGDLNFTLISPNGLNTILVPTNTGDSADNLTWTFTSFRDMGTSSAGLWQLRIADGAGGDTGTLLSWKLNIYGAVPPPPMVVGNPDTYTVAEDTNLFTSSPGVLENDIAATGAILVSNVSNGTLFFNSDGSFFYRGSNNFFGTDSFTYRPTQGALQGDITTVTINVTPVNDNPVANPDGLPNPAYVARPNVPLVLAPQGVLANDTDIDSSLSTLNALIVTGPTKGTLSLNLDGGFTFTARNNTTGPDSFTYRARDAQGGLSNPAQVTLQVNTPPVSRDESFNMIVGGSLTGAVLGNDTDLDQNVMTATLVTPPANGNLALDPVTGNFTYTPNPGFWGIDTFVYRADDPWYNPANPPQVGNTATVSIRVDRLPVVVPDDFEVVRDGTLEVFLPGVLANDFDLDTPIFGDIVQAQLLSQPVNGTLTFGTNGYVKYVPNPGYYGPDSFTYRGHDGLFPGLPGTVNITVLATPSAVNDAYVTFGGNLTVPAATGVLANDTSPSGAPLSAELLTNPSNGSVTLNPDGSFQYAAINGFVGVDSFTYFANDGVFDSQPATVTISVFGINRPPVAANDNFSVVPGVPLNVAAPGILSNDTDQDLQTLQATLVTAPLNGNLLLNVNGSFIYSPLPGFVGVDSFTYRASDGLTLSNEATVTLTVGTAPPPISNPLRRIVLSQEVGGQVKVFAGETGLPLFTINAFPGFTGAARVATGDVTGDGVPDIFVAPGSQTGSAAALKLRGFDGATGLPLPGTRGTGLSPFGASYKGGMQVALGDVNDDGIADIIAGADQVTSTQTLQVRVFNGSTGALFSGTMGSIKPYTGTAFGGVRVAAGDYNGDGRAEIIVAPGAGASPQVKIFSINPTAKTSTLIKTITALTAATSGGVFVAAGDLDGDGKAEVIAGAATNAQGHVRIFAGGTGTFVDNMNVAGSTSGPARVATGDINGDGRLDLVVGMRTPGSVSRARVYDAITLQEMFAGEDRFTFGGGYASGLFAAALNKVSV